jgi:hypothetical protein
VCKDHNYMVMGVHEDQEAVIRARAKVEPRTSPPFR